MEIFSEATSAVFLARFCFVWDVKVVCPCVARRKLFRKAQLGLGGEASFSRFLLNLSFSLPGTSVMAFGAFLCSGLPVVSLKVERLEGKGPNGCMERPAGWTRDLLNLA